MYLNNTQTTSTYTLTSTLFSMHRSSLRRIVGLNMRDVKKAFLEHNKERILL